MTDSTSLRKQIDGYLKALSLHKRLPSNLYEPMEYLLSLPAKRIRPLLVLMAYQAISKGDPSPALPLAAAVELFHNFTLMHDDIMDHAPVRRGQQTVHIKWNINTAILSGDAMFAKTMHMVTEVNPAAAAGLIREYSRVALEVCEGQMEDMDLAGMRDVTVEAYLEMIRKKTAALLGGALTMGAMAANADPEIVAQLRIFGETMGVGFQLQDDLMDAFPPEGFGKQVGGDIQENKKTYLLLRAFELADDNQKVALNRLMDEEEEPETKVRGVLDLYSSLQIENETRQKIDYYFQQAREAAIPLTAYPEFIPLVQYLQEIATRSQ